MQPLVQMRDTWTFEDLQTLDVEDWHRYEIVDGALLVSPTPGLRHGFLTARVRNALQACRGADVEVLSADVGVWMGRSYRVPDLVVVRADQAGEDAPYLQPRDVLLAVEVVSPGSVISDRVANPAQYAAAGIPAYWRVELDPVSLTAYTLPVGASVYAEIGTWIAGQTAHLEQPFPVEIEIDRLV